MRVVSRGTIHPLTPMNTEIKAFHIPFNRRRLLKSMAAASAGFTLPGFLAEALTLSPTVTQGPYYPLADETFWNETAYALNGMQFATQNSNDMVLSGTSDPAEKASLILNFTAVPGTTTGEVQTAWDYVSGYTPSEPTYPASGGFVVNGEISGTGSSQRYKISIPAYAGYTYEVYGNPTLADLDWKALPFSLTQAGAIDRNKHTATAEGTLDIYVAAAATRGFYKVSFRVPGANTGTP